MKLTKDKNFEDDIRSSVNKDEEDMLEFLTSDTNMEEALELDPEVVDYSATKKEQKKNLKLNLNQNGDTKNIKLNLNQKGSNNKNLESNTDKQDEADEPKKVKLNIDQKVDETKKLKIKVKEKQPEESSKKNLKLNINKKDKQELDESKKLKLKKIKQKEPVLKDDLEEGNIFDDLEVYTPENNEQVFNEVVEEVLDEVATGKEEAPSIPKTEDEPKEKAGFFARLFGRGKKKDKKKKESRKKAKNSNKKAKKQEQTEKISKKKSGKNKETLEQNVEEKIKKQEGAPDQSAELIEVKYKQFKRKRILTTTIILMTLLALLVFGTYNTFFKVEKSPQRLAAEVNAVNRTTPFPTDGLEGFIKQYLTEMMEQNVKLDKDANQFSIEPTDIYITDVIKRSAYIANVYFTAYIKTDKGRNPHNFFLAVKYDYENYAYMPASEVQLSPIQPKNDVKIVDNEVLSFDGINKVPDELNAKVQTFVENFLMMLYNEEVDVSPYYKGNDALGDPNAKFVQLLEFQMYEGMNQNRYNAKVVYILEFNEGVEYKVTNYLNIQPTSESGESFIIKSIL